VLLTRVITAVVILAVLVGMVFFASALVWSLFVLAIALAACWEWSRMAGLSARGQSVFLVFSGIIGGALWLAYARATGAAFLSAATTAFFLAAVFWLFAAPVWLAKKARPAPIVCAVAGWLMVWPTWFAFIVLRDASPWLLLAIAALVWVADIAAYFAGRRFGRHKLAPAVSPSKTWEGVAGALLGVAIYGVVLCEIAHHWVTPFSRLFEPAWGLPAIAAMLGLTAVSVIGDLFESWMKRGAGLKDSSQLLPGHGGILDRIDALTSTLPVAAFALSLHAGGAS
jgi:phosphatidate cytidylyltransferase